MTAHLRCWPAGSSLRRTRAYASVGATRPPCIWTALATLSGKRK
jgi:hypothetical protein